MTDDDEPLIQLVLPAEQVAPIRVPETDRDMVSCRMSVETAHGFSVGFLRAMFGAAAADEFVEDDDDDVRGEG